MIKNLRLLFPGDKKFKLFLAVLGLFVVSLLDMVGVALILPVIQLASGASTDAGYLAKLSDLFADPPRETLIIITVIFLVIAFVLKAILGLAIRWWSSGFTALQQAATAVTLLRKYATEDYLSHRKRTTAGIMRTVNDAVIQTYSQFVSGILSAIGELFTILLLMSMLVALMPMQALIAFAYFGISAFTMQRILKKKNADLGSIAIEASKNMTISSLRTIQGFRENRVHGVTDREIYTYQSERLKAVYASRKQGFFQDLPKYLLEIIFIVGIALILLMFMASGKAENAAYLLVFAGACVRLLPSYVRLVSSIGLARVGRAGFVIVSDELSQLSHQQHLEFMGTEPDIGEYAKVNPSIDQINIELNNVGFSYPDSSKQVLKDLNISIPYGTSVALVGGSGAGKTTIIDLILGLLQPTNGSVVFSENDGKVLAHEEWAYKIGYVPQDVFLSGGTIAQEIAYGLKSSEIDMERVHQCVEAAALTDVISELPEGINTLIGENGARLSGGQRQRLGIARALYRNPSILILDEATSALDNSTEHKITETIQRISREITVIIVAHRLSTVRHVDQLIYLSEGMVVSRGTFQQVREHNADFAALVQLGQLPE
ncbi:ABC transporter ATP-binding protein [Rothia terrae]|uniref:ABC transporter ATP-binding protein n=1 Tax=Rothia terrae TaxID=396015 RepID=UPI0033E9CF4E